MTVSEQVRRIHAGNRVAILEAIAEQAVELADEEVPSVTCPCGTELDLVDAFQCFFCHVFLCPSCSEEHFGDEPRPVDFQEDSA